ncbi:glucose 1-dehydrogenase [soil metagenome]
MTGRLEGKVALITGGCSGIGLASVERFVAEGARVIVADIQDTAGAAIEARFDGRVRYSRCDVTVEDEIAAAVDLAGSAYGGLDILFNNAGAGGNATGVMDMDVEAWDAGMAFLLRGPMLGAKYGARAMRARGGGSIVNTASVAALEAGFGLIYGTAKAAVLHLTMANAAELAAHKIRVNAIIPGLILTPALAVSAGVPRDRAADMTGLFADAATRMQPLRRAGQPQDIAAAALYFASDESAFVTGTSLLVDGGIRVGQRSAWDPASPSPLHATIYEILSGKIDA